MSCECEDMLNRMTAVDGEFCSYLIRYTIHVLAKWDRGALSIFPSYFIQAYPVLHFPNFPFCNPKLQGNLQT